MNDIHAGITIGVTELLESPTRILKREEDEDQAVAILNHNKPAGYIIIPQDDGGHAGFHRRPHCREPRENTAFHAKQGAQGQAE